MTFHKPMLYSDWYWRGYRLLKSERFDVFHAHDLNTLPVAALLARMHGARLIYDAHELYPDVSTLSSLESWIWRRFERRLAPRADQVLTVCESIADELQSRNQIRAPMVLLNCPEKATALLPSGDQNQLRAKVGMQDTDEPLILYQGGFAPHRGLPELITALHKIERGVLVLMGWGTLEGALRDQVLTENLGHRVIFTPPVGRDELLVHTAGADIGVIPYRPVGLNNRFTTPNKLFEYIAAGIPIAGSRLPELVRFLDGYGLGVTFEPGDADDIASTINGLILDTAGRAEIRTNALEAREHFVWENQSHVLIDAYRQPMLRQIA